MGGQGYQACDCTGPLFSPMAGCREAAPKSGGGRASCGNVQRPGHAEGCCPVKSALPNVLAYFIGIEASQSNYSDEELKAGCFGASGWQILPSTLFCTSSSMISSANFRRKAVTVKQLHSLSNRATYRLPLNTTWKQECPSKRRRYSQNTDAMCCLSYILSIACNFSGNGVHMWRTTHTDLDP